MSKQNTHGGARLGAGRHPKEETTTINFRVKKRLSIEIKDFLRPIVKKMNEL